MAGQGFKTGEEATAAWGGADGEEGWRIKPSQDAAMGLSQGRTGRPAGGSWTCGWGVDPAAPHKEKFLQRQSRRRKTLTLKKGAPGNTGRPGGRRGGVGPIPSHPPPIGFAGFPHSPGSSAFGSLEMPSSMLRAGGGSLRHCSGPPVACTHRTKGKWFNA